MTDVLDSRTIKSSLNIVRRNRNSFIVAVSIHVEANRNTLHSIKCERGRRINNIPYDVTTDSYQIRCTSLFQFGEIPISFQMEMEGVEGWTIDIPMPKVIKRYPSKDGREALANWKKEQRECRISYLTGTLHLRR